MNQNITVAQLRESKERFPFNLTLENGDVLICEKIFRHLPGKRLVVLARWNEKKVVAKILFQKHKVLRELRGIRFLVDAKINTPKLLLYKKDTSKQADVLLFEYLDGSLALDFLMNEGADKDACQQFGVTLAKLHFAALTQTDMHLLNFLWHNGKVYVIDVASIKKHKNILTKKHCLEDLSLTLSQISMSKNTVTQSVLDAYELLRGWDFSEKELSFLQERQVKACTNKIELMQKKSLRTTSKHRCEKINSGFVMCEKTLFSTAMKEFLSAPDKTINAAQFIKRGNTSSVVKLHIDNKTYIAKRYNIKSFWQGLRRAFKTSRARKNWLMSIHLQAAGINVPTAYAMREQKALGLFNQKSYVLLENIEGEILADYLKRVTEYSGIEKQIQEFFASLERASLSHGDTKITNFMVRDDKLVALDLDAVKYHKCKKSLAKALKKDKQRFLKNWQDDTTLPKLHSN